MSKREFAARSRLAPVSTAPIGVFDSGVGGLTVARAIIDQLPRERLIYVGDTANGPYGPLPIAEVREHALRIMDELVDQGVKLLVDPKSLAYIDGTELDFVREGLNEGFKFNNPNVKDQCGCGESFNV